MKKAGLLMHNLEFFQGDTPLHFVARSAVNPAVAAVLIELSLHSGADLEADGPGETALQFAVQNKHPLSAEAAVQALLRKGANSNAAPEKSSPPLHLAPGHDSPAGLLRLLLAAGADPNGRNSVGQTPLHYAVASDSPAGKAAIDILLAAGADPSAKDAVGQTPLEFAQSFPPMSPAARHLQKLLVSRQAPLQCLGLGLWGLRAGATRRGWAPGYCVLTNQIFCLQAHRCVGDHLAGAGSRWIWLLLWCQQRWDPSCEPGAFSIAGCPGGWGTAAAAAAAATAAAAAPDAAAGAA